MIAPSPLPYPPTEPMFYSGGALRLPWFLIGAALCTALLIPGAVHAQGDDPCSGAGFDPDPTAVAVDAVPIVVTSTTDDYFVLYVKHDVDGAEVELPVW